MEKNNNETLAEYRIRKIEETLESITSTSEKTSKQLLELTILYKQHAKITDDVDELKNKIIKLEYRPAKGLYEKLTNIFDHVLKLSIVALLSYFVARIMEQG